MEFRGVQLIALYLAITLVYARAPSKIVGGEDAADGEFPHQVSLQRNGRHFCGGSILDATHILTAAHCMVNKEGKVKAGVDVVTGIMNHKARNRDNVFPVTWTTYHEGFVKSGTWADDIAVLQLGKPIPFNAKQKPIRLPTRETPAGITAVASGWGATKYLKEKSPFPDYLQKIDMKVFSYADCRNKMGTIINDGYICAWAGKNKGVCLADSGGPLTYNGEVIGLGAFVDPCAKGKPDAFTNVYHYLPWIRETLKY